MKTLTIGYVYWSIIVLGVFLEARRRDRAHLRRQQLQLAEDVRREIARAAAYDRVFRDLVSPPTDRVEVEVSEFGVFVASQDMAVVASVVATHPAFGGHQ